MGGSIARNAKRWLCLQAQFLPKELFESFRLRHKPVAEFIRVGLLLQLQILRCPIYYFVEAATVVTIKNRKVDISKLLFGHVVDVREDVANLPDFIGSLLKWFLFIPTSLAFRR
jgi:hypothetical protein